MTNFFLPTANCQLPTVFRVIFLLAFFAVCGVQVSAQDVAVRGETVYTMAGQPIRDGVVLIRGGKIERVGLASEV
ncbi:MAG: hypothetical protein H7Y30_05245, partial [Pyrinomonadaceae bacterium]|nr:hypothetical protein [Pyrinomonadaceae bacterium]